MRIPRLMLAAPASGSGKTLITCGLLQCLMNRKQKTVSFKCGPDYIDPMFHTTVIGTRSRNLDTFFTDEATTRYLLQKNAAGADIAVIEGVMGYYDGLGGVSTQASAYDVARVTDTPAVLIVNTRGMSLSVVPFIQGFAGYRPDSHIQGVILNRMNAMLYPQIKAAVENELGIRVYGYVPQTQISLESRHLGLVLPSEIPSLREKLQQLAAVLEQTLDIDGLLKLAGSAGQLEQAVPEALEKCLQESRTLSLARCADGPASGSGSPAQDERVTIAVSSDEGFCFLYEDNLELLRLMGADLVFFSPIHDEKLPRADGLLLCGGYPELYLEQLSHNTKMLAQIRAAVTGGMPTMAECGGFMYLMQEMEDMDGRSWPVVGALEGRAFRTKKLTRFGYIALEPSAAVSSAPEMAPPQNAGSADSSFAASKLRPAEGRPAQMLGDDIGQIRGHEFHYFDTTDNGDAFVAKKPLRHRSWNCIQASPTLIAGFPHLYYYSNPKVPERFVRACAEYRRRQ